MAYKSMFKLITNKNLQLAEGKITAEEYAAWKESTLSKLDVFLTCNRLTETDYTELVGMMQ